MADLTLGLIWYNEKTGEFYTSESEYPYDFHLPAEFDNPEHVDHRFWIICDTWETTDYCWEFINWLWKKLLVYDYRQDESDYDGDIDHPKISLSFKDVKKYWKAFKLLKGEKI